MSNAKSAASDLFNRYIWLANTVYNAGEITYEEICDRWCNSGSNTTGCEMTLRTFHNHRNAILELFDIDIQCNKHNGWKYYVANVGDIGNDSLRRWMLSTLAVNNLVKESKDLRDKILFEYVPSCLNYLTQIIEALRECSLIEFEHKGFWRDTQYMVTLEPYALKLYKQRWYVVGRNLELDAIRIYALDRVLDCHTLGQQFQYPEDFCAEKYFSDYYGVYVDDNVKIENVRIQVNKIQSNYLRSLPMHQSQKELETGKNYSVFEYTIRPTVDFIGALVEMAEFCKVLSPEWIANEVKETIKRMAKMQRS